MNKEISKAIIKTFKYKDSAFLAPLLCSLNIQLDPKVETAETDGDTLFLNEEFFLGLSEDEKIFILLHEVWHIARLHMLRINGRDMKIWNLACDIRINNDLKKLTNLNVRWDLFLYDHSYDQKKIATEEEIYDQLIKSSIPKNSPLSGDIRKPKDPTEAKTSIVSKVVNAYQQAKIAKGLGDLSSDYTEFLDNFLSSKVPWTTLLHDFLTDLGEKDYSWRKPNRRYEDIYLPSLLDEEEKLEHIVLFLDTSGSISKEEVLRFNSEAKYIWDYFQPKKLTLVQFDTKIKSIKEFEEDDSFEKIEVIGRGGTSLVEVEKYIRDKKPTCSVIFSDMFCKPMKEVSTPIVFIVSNHKNWFSPFGKVIHINEN